MTLPFHWSKIPQKDSPLPLPSSKNTDSGHLVEGSKLWGTSTHTTIKSPLRPTEIKGNDVEKILPPQKKNQREDNIRSKISEYQC